jgi:hypothetical protein
MNESTETRRAAAAAAVRRPLIRRRRQHQATAKNPVITKWRRERRRVDGRRIVKCFWLSAGYGKLLNVTLFAFSLGLWALDPCVGLLRFHKLNCLLKLVVLGCYWR